ncbi:hypothetical protein [Beggiatoa leptomitoformis]|uniref:Uncharacterized protein n=1 Tax=Beggiatoa leptomitoformis TaxID=288004 RepID=A0A2N9YI00_9GAMM|nr:hypothetical protein [Beggiatoa leptomitoformis]ALG67650.1 hypothetical protein AL038_07955 [Beggiatoa leptomitoformis]AUI70114.1 hypothetical protein BLE401_16355 [Beggiatoa leptomitoformis]
MSVAYYLVVNQSTADMSAMIDGKLLGKNAEMINQLAMEQDLPLLDDFVGMDESLAEQFELSEEIISMDNQWFNPEQGIEWFSTMMGLIAQQPNHIAHIDELLLELQLFIDVLQQLKAHSLQWRLGIDY